MRLLRDLCVLHGYCSDGTMRRLIVATGLALAVSIGVAAAESPIADAAARGDREAVRALLKKAADVNAAQGDSLAVDAVILEME